jgi:hypothetical protein
VLSLVRVYGIFELTVLENRFWMVCSVTKGHEPQNCFLLRCYSPPFPWPCRLTVAVASGGTVIQILKGETNVPLKPAL